MALGRHAVLAGGALAGAVEAPALARVAANPTRDRELAARRGAEPHDKLNGPSDGLQKAIRRVAEHDFAWFHAGPRARP